MVAPQKELKTSGSQTVKKIVVLDKDKKQCRTFCAVLAERDYQAVPIHSMPDLDRCLQKGHCLVVIVDLDTVAIDNRVIRDLKIKNPGLYFLCVSSDRVHPELEDALYYHIYACFNKPVDPEELFYLLRSIFEDEANPKNQHEV